MCPALVSFRAACPTARHPCRIEANAQLLTEKQLLFGQPVPELGNGSQIREWRFFLRFKRSQMAYETFSNIPSEQVRDPTPISDFLPSRLGFMVR